MSIPVIDESCRNYRNYVLAQSNMVVSLHDFLANIHKYHHLQDVVTSWGQELWGVFNESHCSTAIDSIIPFGQKIDVGSREEYDYAVRAAKQEGVIWYAVMVDE